MAIHILAVPREVRTELPATPASHSAEAVNDDDSFCQKSELAIESTQTSNLLKTLDYGLLGLTGNKRETRFIQGTNICEGPLLEERRGCCTQCHS